MAKYCKTSNKIAKNLSFTHTHTHWLTQSQKNRDRKKDHQLAVQSYRLCTKVNCSLLRILQVLH